MNLIHGMLQKVHSRREQRHSFWNCFLNFSRRARNLQFQTWWVGGGLFILRLTHTVPETPLSIWKVTNWILATWYKHSVSGWTWTTDSVKKKLTCLFNILSSETFREHITVFPFRTTLSKIQNCGRFVSQETWQRVCVSFCHTSRPHI
jgi:hypothetical protein